MIEEIVVPEIATGIYFIRLFDGEKYLTERLMISKE
jgi:hypothetical protein